MSVNTPASWSAHALRMRLGMPSGPAALRGLTHLNLLLTLAAVKECPQVLVAGRVSGIVLSSKRAKLFSLSRSKTTWSATGMVFLLLFVIDCWPCHIPLVSEPLNCDYFVSILTLSFFDCFAEGIATLFVFGHVSGHLALIKSNGLRFQFCANAAINPRFLGECFNRRCGYNITDALANKLGLRISVFMLLSDTMRNISLSTWSKQSWSMKSDWLDERWTDLSTGASCFSFRL